jgi:hypothetical protein
MSRRHGVLFALLAFAAAPSVANAIELQPGQWRDVETGTENGEKAAPETFMNCLTPAETKDLIKAFSPEKEVRALRGKCQTLESKLTPSGYSMRVKCGDPEVFALDVSANYTFTSPQSYTATMKTIVRTMGAPSVLDKKIEGRWVSATCSR